MRKELSVYSVAEGGCSLMICSQTAKLHLQSPTVSVSLWRLRPPIVQH